eukprot:4236598-Lingulodinium_polyedra.AAC.1
MAKPIRDAPSAPSFNPGSDASMDAALEEEEHAEDMSREIAKVLGLGGDEWIAEQGVASAVEAEE